MRYCPNCLEEYEDSAQTCADCNEALVTQEALAERKEFRRVREDDDTTRFVVVGPAEDPFEADAFTAAVSEAGIPVLARMKRGSAVDALTDATQHAWWEILVPAEQREKAAEVLGRRREELAASEADAEKAAEEEELAGEAGEAKKE